MYDGRWPPLTPSMLANRPLVSIIIPTCNSGRTLAACLETVRHQTYAPLETIVVDRRSSDGTKEVARHYGVKLANWGPNRSAQCNHGAEMARGKYLLFLDSDRELSIKVVEDCVRTMIGDSRLVGLVIPEEPYGQGFWSECRKLETSFYRGIGWMESARFFRQDRFWLAGGFDLRLENGADWDLAQRLAQAGGIGRINSMIRHNQGRLTFRNLMDQRLTEDDRASLIRYADEVGGRRRHRRLNPFMRLWLFLRRPRRLFARPALGIGLLALKTCQFAANSLDRRPVR